MEPINSPNASNNSRKGSADYAGIYVGITRSKGTPSPKEQLCHLNQDNSRNLQLQSQQSVENKGSCNENTIAIVHETASSTFTPPVKNNLSHSPKTSCSSPSILNPSALPNQVFDEEEMISNRKQEFNHSCTPGNVLDDKVKSTSSVATMFNTTSKKELQTREHRKYSMIDNEISTIAVIDELPSIDSAVDSHTDATLPKFADKDIENASTLSPCIDTNELYKDSKEHKSIVKASIANMIFLFFVAVLIIIAGLFKPTSDNLMRIALVIGVILKFYRTFSVIFMTIYCFEVVYDLFQQTALNIKDDVQNLYNMVRDLF